jgi:hypothetical protein
VPEAENHGAGNAAGKTRRFLEQFPGRAGSLSDSRAALRQLFLRGVFAMYRAGRLFEAGCAVLSRLRHQNASCAMLRIKAGIQVFLVGQRKTSHSPPMAISLRRILRHRDKRNEPQAPELLLFGRFKRLLNDVPKMPATSPAPRGLNYNTTVFG